MGFKDLMKKGFGKVKDIVKEELKDRRKIKLEMLNMSDQKLKQMAINQGQPYKNEYIKRYQKKKELNELLKK